MPLPEQSFKQALSEQSSPIQPSSQAHEKFLQHPWPEQSLGQITRCEQSAPRQPSMQ